MYPNYFFKAPTYAPPTGNYMPAIREEPQYGESRADTVTHSQTTVSNNQNTGNNTNLLDFGTITPPIQDDINYTQGYLRTQIGKYVRIDFLIGTNLFIDKEGILRQVGISYLVLEESGSGDMVMCDIYAVKFVATVKRENALMQATGENV